MACQICHNTQSSMGSWYSRVSLTYDSQRCLFFFLKICCVSVHTKTWYAMIWSIIVVSALRWPPATAWVTMEQRSRDGTASTLCWSLTQSFYNTSGKNSAAKFNHWQRYVLSSLKGESLISWAYILVNSNIFSHRCAFNIFVSRFQNSGCVCECEGTVKKGCGSLSRNSFQHVSFFIVLAKTTEKYQHQNTKLLHLQLWQKGQIHWLPSAKVPQPSSKRSPRLIMSLSCPIPRLHSLLTCFL